MYLIRFALSLSCLLLLACEADSKQQNNSITANLRSTSFVTNDLELSAEFYIKYLNYREHSRSDITAEKSRQVIGAKGSEPIKYISLVPAGWSKETSDFAGVSFIAMSKAEASPFNQDETRIARAGELVLAHRVTNIAEINRKMIADGVPIIAPLSPSGSGKSMSMAVLDPNGIRVEMYEY